MFKLAGIYGLFLMVPVWHGLLLQWPVNEYGLASEGYVYKTGYIGLAIVWPLVLLLIATRPHAYPNLLPIAVLQKISFSVVVGYGGTHQALPRDLLAGAAIDICFAIAFMVSYYQFSRIRR